MADDHVAKAPEIVDQEPKVQSSFFNRRNTLNFVVGDLI
jgi:hypothetical protein